ncbi:PLDX1 protein, partial [Columbina picui]|nr:PLDX1 protein [Columbina picui]
RLQEDNHSYYVSRIYGPGDARLRGLWVDMAAANRSQVKVHGILSNTHRQASRIVLSFDFPFYGHLLRQVTIATGGELGWGGGDAGGTKRGGGRSGKGMEHPGDCAVCSLRFYLHGGHWEGVSRGTGGAALADGWAGGSAGDAGPVGDAGPIDAGPVGDAGPIGDAGSVGLSGVLPRAGAAVAATFLSFPACLQHQSCETCVSSELTFNCSWCHVLQRCSSGFDRYREEWLSYGCGQKSDERTCEDLAEGYSAPPDGSVPPRDGDDAGYHRRLLTLFILPFCFLLSDDTKLNQYAGGEGVGSSLPSKQTGAPVHTGTIVGIVLAVLLIATIILAGIYINSHPTSTAALFFIERRPHRWPTMKFRNHTNQATYAEVEPASQEKEGFVEAEQC